MLLALDTSTRMVGVALYDGAQVLSESLWTSQNYHTVELAPAVADMLAKCGITADQLSSVAVLSLIHI
jgi:tRNA threonylcarbamoyladenosine biosynthesis protein TsaB